MNFLVSLTPTKWEFTNVFDDGDIYRYDILNRVGPRGLVANVSDYNIVVSEFELQSRYYVHFRTIPLGKVLTSLSPKL